MEQKKIALITGGSRGLGKNAALKIAQKGFDVIITYRNKKEEAEAVVAEIETAGQKAAALQLDTGIAKSFDAFAETLKATLAENWSRDNFDFLVNNAGIDAAAPFAQTTEEDFDHLFNVHFKGVYFLTQKLAPVIADGGRIINISTGLTRFATPGYAAYASMKGAIEVFTKYLAKELGSRKIAANMVAPGIIETDLPKELLMPIRNWINTCQALRHWVVLVSRMTLAGSSHFFVPKTPGGSMPSASRHPVACSYSKMYRGLCKNLCEQCG